MTRLPYALALSLLASPALAGPPIEQPAPTGVSGAATIYDCQIAGRTERFVIAGGALAEGPGTLSVLTEDVYVVTRGGVTYLIDPTGVQIDQGVDAGKWPCVESTAAPAPTPAVPDAGQMARIVELEAEVANLQAALSAANGERDAAIAAGEAALAARDEAEASSAAASTAAQTALNEAAALQSRAETAETAATTAIAAQAAAEARVVELEAAAAASAVQMAEVRTSLDQTMATLATANARVAELEAAATADATEMAQMRTLQGQMAETLAAAEARVAELEQALAASMAAPEEDMAEDNAEDAGAMTEGTEETAEDMSDDTGSDDMTEDHGAMEDAAFDADAALMAIEAADLSPISRAALTAAVEQARNNPDFVAEVVTRLQNALGE